MPSALEIGSRSLHWVTVKCLRDAPLTNDLLFLFTSVWFTLAMEEGLGGHSFLGGVIVDIDGAPLGVGQWAATALVLPGSFTIPTSRKDPGLQTNSWNIFKSTSAYSPPLPLSHNMGRSRLYVMVFFPWWKEQ